MFILDSNAPEFKFNKTFYTDQLSKGLIINIYKNGSWGSYKKIVIQNLDSNNINIEDKENSKLKNILMNK